MVTAATGGTTTATTTAGESAPPSTAPGSRVTASYTPEFCRRATATRPIRDRYYPLVTHLKNKSYQYAPPSDEVTQESPMVEMQTAEFDTELSLFKYDDLEQLPAEYRDLTEDELRGLRDEIADFGGGRRGFRPPDGLDRRAAAPVSR